MKMLFALDCRSDQRKRQTRSLLLRVMTHDTDSLVACGDTDMI